ncbi:MAG: hypothetical protein FWH25_00525 [Syntrophorhabdaceae bacterium]|nr:hypothetical protein [Syntrophorhabdaceae bacterium]
MGWTIDAKNFAGTHHTGMRVRFVQRSECGGMWPPAIAETYWDENGREWAVICALEDEEFDKWAIGIFRQKIATSPKRLTKYVSLLMREAADAWKMRRLQ